MIPRITRTAVLCCLAASACLGETKVFAPPKVDFSDYHTYHWSGTRLMSKTGLTENPPDLDPMIRKAVNEELAARGFKEVPSGGDMQIHAGAIGSGTVTVDAVRMLWDWDIYYGYAYGTADRMVGWTSYHRQGTLAIGIVDAKTKKALWSGFDSEGMATQISVDSVEKTVNKAAGKLFKKFPVKRKS